MSVGLGLLTAALFLGAADGSPHFEDAREGYLFVLHEDKDLLLATKDGNCYFVSITELKTHSLYSPVFPITEDEVLKLLNSATPATVTRSSPTAFHAQFGDEIADIMCQGRQLFNISLLSHAPSRYDCDFEHNLCQWRQGSDDKFDWARWKGSTPSSGTGPTVDHTLGNDDGYYLYIETSGARLNGDNARLESPTVYVSKAFCLTFWYHLYGTSLGNLNVRLHENGGTGVPLWSVSSPSEDVWKQARISIPAQNAPFNFVIEAVRGNSYNGDIAIDDIVVLDSPCP